jgi:hypothetical protein
VTASPPGSDRTGYEVNTIRSGTDLEYNISGLDPITNYSIFIMAIGVPQLPGRVDTEILVLTGSGMECYYDNDMHILQCRACIHGTTLIMIISLISV